MTTPDRFGTLPAKGVASRRRPLAEIVDDPVDEAKIPSSLRVGEARQRLRVAGANSLSHRIELAARKRRQADEATATIGRVRPALDQPVTLHAPQIDHHARLLDSRDLDQRLLRQRALFREREEDRKLRRQNAKPL